MQVVEENEAELDPVVRLRKTSPKVTGGLLRMREAAYADGVFPAKVKALAALTLSVAIRCEPCIETYVEKAIDEGATYEEVVEFLNVAMAMQGCPGEAWALKALGIFQRLVDDTPRGSGGTGTDACCEE